MGTHGRGSRDLKLEVMRQHYKEGKDIKELAGEYGIPLPTLYGWRQQYRKHGANAFVGCGNRFSGQSARAEIAQLRAEIERMRAENIRLRGWAATATQRQPK